MVQGVIREHGGRVSEKEKGKGGTLRGRHQKVTGSQ